MTRSEFMQDVAKQCDYLNALILEAERSIDNLQRDKLYSIAQSKNNDVITSLRAYILKVAPDKRLKAA